MRGDDRPWPGLRLWPFRRRPAAAPACPACQTPMEPKEALYDPVLGPLMGAHARRHVCPACHASRLFAAGTGMPAKPGAAPAEAPPAHGAGFWAHRFR